MSRNHESLHAKKKNKTKQTQSLFLTRSNTYQAVISDFESLNNANEADNMDP